MRCDFDVSEVDEDTTEVDDDLSEIDHDVQAIDFDRADLFIEVSGCDFDLSEVDHDVQAIDFDRTNLFVEVLRTSRDEIGVGSPRKRINAESRSTWSEFKCQSTDPNSKWKQFGSICFESGMTSRQFESVHLQFDSVEMDWKSKSTDRDSKGLQFESLHLDRNSVSTDLFSLLLHLGSQRPGILLSRRHSACCATRCGPEARRPPREHRPLPHRRSRTAWVRTRDRRPARFPRHCARARCIRPRWGKTDAACPGPRPYRLYSVIASPQEAKKATFWSPFSRKNSQVTPAKDSPAPHQSYKA